jgi:hypothetical protein
MADQTVVHIGENSPEKVAYDLMRNIAINEGRSFNGPGSPNLADRKWILDTYAECLLAIRNPIPRARGER